MKQQNNIKVFPTDGELTRAAALFIIDTAKAAVLSKGQFSISLSGGHTPEQLYALLANPPYKNEMPWNKTFVFWGDERWVALDDKDNNAHMAKVQLLDHIDIPATNIFPIPVNLPPAQAATEYERVIISFFKDQPPAFDLILLGLGENGHTASLFPGTTVLSEHSRLVKEVYVEEVNMYRITMTAPLINKSRNIMFLVAGEGKAEILNTVLNSPSTPDKYPAQMISPTSGNLYWYIDEKAEAKLLKQ
ncbi:MAG: 6-phosphogluconolactonase [Flavipsychrobacter sp.]|nr:6-phosphogluconolactonase [Flavipsychrobacter sp.]